MVARLKPMKVRLRLSTSHVVPPSAGGASSAARPSPSSGSAIRISRRRLPSRSLHCPSSGSINASAKRVSSSTAPTSASGRPTLSAYRLGTWTYKGSAAKASGKPSAP
jgi:hypothetical protein